MEISFKLIEGYPAEDIVEAICSLHETPYPKNNFESQLKHQRRVVGCYAYLEGEIVGYKMGYESRPGYFESWMGAVSHKFRRKGIAAKLMDLQHKWCIKENYRFITTNASTDNNPMIILNLKSGFEICGTLLDRGKHHKVFFQKAINKE